MAGPWRGLGLLVSALALVKGSAPVVVRYVHISNTAGSSVCGLAREVAMLRGEQIPSDVVGQGTNCNLPDRGPGDWHLWINRHTSCRDLEAEVAKFNISFIASEVRVHPPCLPTFQPSCYPLISVEAYLRSCPFPPLSCDPSVPVRNNTVRRCSKKSRQSPATAVQGKSLA